MAIPRDSLLGEWLGAISGGQLLDTSGNGFHGAIHGTVTEEDVNVPMERALAFLLNGGGGYVSMPAGSWVLGNAPRALSFWAYTTDDFSESYNYPVGYGTNSTSRQVVVWFKPTEVSVSRYGALITASFDPRGAWNHYVVMHDGSESSLWINGVQVGYAAWTLDTGPLGFRYGENISGSAPYYGYLSRCRMYSRALSSSEITELHTETVPLPVVHVTGRAAAPCSLGANGRGSALLDLMPLVGHAAAPCGLGLSGRGQARTVLGVNGHGGAVVALGTSGRSQLRTALGTGGHGSSRSTMGAQGRAVIHASLGPQGRAAVLCDLPAVVQGRGRAIMDLLGTGKSFHAAAVMDLRDRISGRGHAVMDLSNPEVRVHQHDYRITLAGVDVTGQVTSCSLSQSEDSLHDSLDMTIARERPGPDLLRLARVGAEIVVAIDNTNHRFVLDDRTVEETGLRITALSRSILADAPHAEEISLSGPMLASAAATLLTTGAAIDVAWQAHDWMLPADYTFSGLPLAGLAELAAACGAVVRASGDGLIVRPRYPARPVYLHRAPLAADYTRSDLLALSAAETPGSGYRGVTVTGWSADAALPELELMDPGAGQNGYALGDDVHVLAWWPGEALAVLAWVSDGTVQERGARIVTRTETLEVVGGHCETARPVHRLVSSMWIGRDNGPVAWKRGSRDIYTGPDYGLRGLIEVTYEARAVQYTLSNHDVSELLFVLAADTGDAASATVWLSGGGDLDPEDLASELLTDRAAAVVRGMAYLDRTAYPVLAAQFDAPYAAGVRDGVVVAVDDALVGVSGRCHVAGVTTQISPGRITQSVEVLQWRVSST